jgi:hypothetical protein
MTTDFPPDLSIVASLVDAHTCAAPQVQATRAGLPLGRQARGCCAAFRYCLARPAMTEEMKAAGGL